MDGVVGTTVDCVVVSERLFGVGTYNEGVGMHVG